MFGNNFANVLPDICRTIATNPRFTNANDPHTATCRVAKNACQATILSPLKHCGKNNWTSSRPVRHCQRNSPNGVTFTDFEVLRTKLALWKRVFSIEKLFNSSIPNFWPPAGHQGRNKQNLPCLVSTAFASRHKPWHDVMPAAPHAKGYLSEIICSWMGAAILKSFLVNDLT